MAWRRFPSAHAPLATCALAAICALLATCALAGLGATAASANAPNAEAQTGLDRAVRFLQEAQNPDGGFGGFRGGESDPGFSSWAAIALAAAGINPQDQRQPQGVDVYTYLTRHAGALSVTTDFERALLVADASGASPHDFGGVDLVTAILARKRADGSFAHASAGQDTINDTVFAILALSPVREPAAAAGAQEGASWLEGEQLSDGGWPSSCPKTLPGCSPEAEVDMTAAALEALVAAGRHDTPVELRAYAFLKQAQNGDGGFPERPSEPESNADSTAWATQALWAGGQDPEAWVKGAANPLQFMISLQQPDGSIRFKRGEDANPVWNTSYVLPALAVQPLPVSAAPRSKPPAPTPTPNPIPPSTSSSTPGAGGGGDSSQRGGGVIAGGGGYGARLFSHPRPQSRGRARAGRRALHDPRAHRSDAAAGPADANVRRARRQPAGSRSVTAGAPATASLQESAAEAPTRGGDTARSGATGTAERSSGVQVDGLLISAPSGSHAQRAVQAAAVGLRAAGEGGDGSSWLAVAIAAAVALLAASGSLLERRRPRMVL